jgi:hypothetical protein
MPCSIEFGIKTGTGNTMSMLSLAAPVALDAPKTENPFKLIVLFCCTGLLVSFGVMAQGVDLSAAWISLQP